MKGPYSSLVIANKILEIAKDKNIKLTMMQLLKLVYISHGWWLTLTGGQPLTKDSVQAWQYGPVYPAVYKEFRHNGSNKITKNASVCPEEIDDDVIGLLEQVVDAYGEIHAYALSDMTHKPGTPWTVTSQVGGYYAEIPDTLIKDHFDDLREKRA